MKVLLTQLLVFSTLSLSAQFGATVNYNSNQVSTDWMGVMGSTSELPTRGGYEAQLHYWFRLPDNRVEFQPTVYYHGAGIGWSPGSTDFREIGFQFEVNVYPFDFMGDCGCPTFGKQGPQLQKGLFLQLSPGVARRSITASNPEPVDLASIDFTYGAGIGLDIGLSNVLTLTPIASVRRGAATFDGSLDPLFNSSIQLLEGDEGAATFTSYQVGLQVTFRFDEKNY